MHTTIKKSNKLLKNILENSKDEIKKIRALIDKEKQNIKKIENKIPKVEKKNI